MLTISIIIDIPESFRKEAEYTIANIFFPYRVKLRLGDRLGCHQGCAGEVIYCHSDSPLLKDAQQKSRSLFVIAEGKTLEYFAAFRPIKQENLSWIKGIPCLFPLQCNEKFRSLPNIFPFDIFAASFFFLSCWQEYTIIERDPKGRIPLKTTLQNELGVIHKPVVNEYLKLFQNYAMLLWDVQLEYKKLPGGSNNYFAISHDIDISDIDCTFSRYLKSLFANKHILSKKPPDLLAIFRNLLGKKHLFYKLKKIETRNSVTSTNFFLSEYPSRFRSFVDELIDSFGQMSHEIGHHISDMSIFGETLTADRNSFSQKIKIIVGERVHTLRFEVHKLFSLLEANAYHYDNSLLFPESMGYRTSFTFPHYLFDPINKKTFDVLAIPLNIMDATLFDSKFIGLNFEQASEELFTFLDSATLYPGVTSMVWHNHYFWINTNQMTGLYDELFKYMAKKNIQVGTCRTIFNWHLENKLSLANYHHKNKDESFIH